MIAGRNQRAPAQNGIVGLRLFHGDLAQAVQAVGKRAGEDFRHVLHDHDAGSVRGQDFQQRAKRLGAAGGCADHHDFFGGFEHGAGGARREWHRR